MYTGFINILVCCYVDYIDTYVVLLNYGAFNCVIITTFKCSNASMHIFVNIVAITDNLMIPHLILIEFLVFTMSTVDTNDTLAPNWNKTVINISDF